MATSGGDFLLVAAIDFGTTFSGYAFSFIPTKKDPECHEKIRTNKSWGASLGFQSYKTPTSVLTDTKGAFIAFGFDAEEKYSQALEDEDSSDEEEEASKPDMLLFRHFKMILHKQETVKLKSTIVAVDGTIHPALDIFAYALQYLKDHLLKAIKLETGALPKNSDIRWVVTVPAIWGDSSKQFMREAALKAGCILGKDSKKLVIALEPEAASLFCRRLNMAEYMGTDNISFPMGTKYIILDCGGGTVDITAHVVEFDKKIKELLCASGGPWGGTKVDDKFIEFMESILGKNFMNTYRKKHPREYLQFLTNFEKAKKAFKGDEKITIALPWAMGHLYAEMNTGKKIDKVLKKTEGISFASGMISIKLEVAKEFYEPVIKSILNHVQDLVKQDKVKGLKYILMVGGFSECEVLQTAVKRQFEVNGTKVLIPSEAQLAIIKGAVLFGHQPDEITTRVLQKSYGIVSKEIFKDGYHDVSKKFLNIDGKYYCRNVFYCLVQKGAEIKKGKPVKSECSTTSKENLLVQFFSMDKETGKHPDYTSDPHVNPIGDFIVKSNCPSTFEISLEFGDTEIFVEVLNKTTGKRETNTIDFLS